MRPTGIHLDTCTDTRYSIFVLRTFRHRGLKRLFQDGDAGKVQADQLQRIVDVLSHLDTAVRPADVDLPGYRLHRLKGYWSVSISGNRRIIFRFEEGDVFDVDLVDYH